MRDIPGFEGRYAITSCGKVWSHLSKKFLVQRKDKDGYLRISLRTGPQEQLKTYQVHRLVAITYLPNPNNLSEVNHKDEVKSNNCLTNLEWCSHKYNMNYGSRTNRASNSRKQRSQERL